MTERTFTRSLRGRVVGGVIGAVGLDDTVDNYRSPRGDKGLFGPDSTTWRVHADLPAMLIGGLSSLMLQTLHPLAMAGVAQHSRYRTDPLGRLRRTAEFVAGTTYGPTSFAEELLERVRNVHTRVHGVAPDGRPYDARDPDLLTWVHATEVWSFLRAYQRYARPLAMREKDRYLAEVSTIAYRLGVRHVPENVAAMRAYFRSMQPALHATSDAKAVVTFLREPLSKEPMEALAHELVIHAAIDLLPGFARRNFGLIRLPVVSHAVVRAGAMSFAAILRWAIPHPTLADIARERVLAS